MKKWYSRSMINFMIQEEIQDMAGNIHSRKPVINWESTSRHTRHGKGEDWYKRHNDIPTQATDFSLMGISKD